MKSAFPATFAALRAIRPLAALAVAALIHQAQAADYWWDSNGTTAGFGNTTGTWGTSAFWSTSNAGTSTPTAAVTNSADVVNFGTATLNYANGTVGITAGGVTVNSIIYGTAQSTAINLGTAGNTLTLAGATSAITVNNPSASHTIISPVAGSVGLSKEGNGILLLTGTNTYTGGTSVNAGTLGFRNPTSKPASGSHTFGPGTTLGLGVGGSGFTTTDVDNAFAGTMTGNLSDITVAASTSIGIDTTAGNLSYTVPGSPGRGLTKLGANTLTLNGTNSYIGATTIAGGTLAVNTLANAGANSSIGNFATAGATGLTLSGGTLNYTGSSTTTDRGFSTIGSVVNTINVGAGVNLALGASVKNETSSGLTFTASGAGSSTTISSLTITPGTNADFNISTNNPAVTIQNLNVSGYNVIVQRTGSAAVNIGNINGTNASGWLGNMNVTGVISGYTGELVLGSAVVNLTGLNTFDPSVVSLQQAGIYTINTIKNWGAGASSFGNPSTAARGNINFGNGGNSPTLKYIGTGGADGTTNRVLNLRGSGTLNLEQAGTGLLKFTANTTADAGNTGAKTLNFTGSTSGTGEFSGAIVEHTTTNKTSVSKSGSGKWTLSGANSYTGTTTVNAGTLALGANNTLPDTSALSIGAATLDAATFTDTAGTLSISAAATINLGSGAALTFADSSAVAWPGTLNITGTFTSTSLRFSISGGGLTTTQLGKITVNGTGPGEYSLNSSGYLIYQAGPPDTTPPSPNPMTWAAVPPATGSDIITMTATTATDTSGVEYFFDETSGNPGGTDSGWQDSPTYTDTGLNPNTTYTYTVTARDKSTGQNATSASVPASATTAALPLYTVWNVHFASQAGNQITTADNFIGAATENTANSTWNTIATTPQTALILKRSTGDNTGVTMDYTGGGIGTQNLLSGPKIFNSRVAGNINLTLKGLTVANSYDIVFYSDWWWKNGDALPITQTEGTGLTGTFFLNRSFAPATGNVTGLAQDSNPADNTSTTGNWMRINDMVPTVDGEIAFRLTDGNNTPFNGFQLIATPIAPKADILELKLASNPPSIRDAVISGTNVTLSVPYGTDVTNLAPTYVLWPGATCTTPSGTARNFTTPQTYTVTSSDSLVTKDYTVTAVIAPPLPEFTLSAPANWDGRTTITVQPAISNLALLQANNGTNFTYNWSVSNVAVTQTTSPSIMTLTRSQGSGSLLVTLTMNNGTENVTRSTTITVQEPATDPWVERTPLPNEKPIANQFFARNPFTNLGTIFYRGTQSGTPDDVFLKVYRTPSGGSETLYSTLRQSLAEGTYDFTAQIDAGLFTYRVVYGTRTSGIDTDLATVNNLLCGDAFIIEGQSNAQATANDDSVANPQVNTSDPWVKTYDASLGWGPAYAKPLSPEWGSKVGYWGMKLAQDIVAQHSMPVCLINGAVGGTYIAQHQPNPANRTIGAGTYDIYANLLNRVIAARLTHGIRGVFWHQGESDAATFGPPVEPDYLSYEQYFLSMSSAWKQDFPNFQRYVVFQIAPNPCSIGPFASEIREVQRQLPRLYSNMSLVNSIAVPGYGGCHYSKAGYETLAGRVLPVVKRDFYGVTYPAAVTPPNLVKAYFTSTARTAIALQFDQPMSWSSFSLPNWFVNDVANQVSSGSASGNIVTLQLSSAVSLNSTLDYVKDTWNFNESVSTLLYGANGIPALTFADVPIGALTPYESWSSSKGLNGLAAAGDADPDNDGVKNAIEFVLGGEPNPANPGSNSTALLPISSRNPAGDLVFNFKRKIASVGGVNLTFRWSENLTFPSLNTVPIGATNSTTDGITVAISTFDAATDNITITVPASKAAAGKLFGRLEVATP